MKTFFIKSLTILALTLFMQAELLFSQVSISKTAVDFSLKIEENETLHILTFWKDKDSIIYTSVKYSTLNLSSIRKDLILTDEIEYIKKLWTIAEDSIQFNLRSFNIGYPLQYADVLKNHIKAFKESTDWQSHVKEHGKELDYKLIRSVMFEANIYKALNDFLKTKDYKISGFETEKHGFVTKENLLEAGFSSDEIIPMPFIVWLKLEHIK